MLENTTVTMTLEDFDALRDAEKAYKKLRSHIANCFELTQTKNEEPKECTGCPMEIDCDGYCEVFQNHKLYDEKITVYIGQLVDATKQYAFYGKDLEIDIDDPDILIEIRRNKGE